MWRKNFGKSVFIWLDGYSFVNTPLPHFPVSIIPAYRKLFKGFLLLTLNVFLLDGLQILNFLSNWDFQISMTKINLFFLHVPIRINPINKLKFFFYFHISFFLQRIYEGLDTIKKRENENLSWFLFRQFFLFVFWNARDREC